MKTLRFAVVMMAVTSVAIPATLYAQDMEPRLEEIRNNFDGLTDKIAGLNKRITEYTAMIEGGTEVDDATEQAMDTDWAETMKIVTHIIAYSKPTGTLMFGIDEALMAANIDIKRMENSGKDELNSLIESMKLGRAKLEKLKTDIGQIHNGANEFKMKMRRQKHAYSYRKRAERFHNIVNTMTEVVGGLSKTVSELKGVSDSEVLSSSIAN